jgi:NAD(P)H-dependent FMN reductase
MIKKSVKDNHPATKKILAICGSTRSESANLHIIRAVQKMAPHDFSFEIYNELAGLPHFNPDLDNDNPPAIVGLFRDKILKADGILICTPEYVFSVPGSLKNALEWAGSTTVFSDKPVAIITASTLGEKAHESLQLIMRTIGAKMNQHTQLLIKSVKAKIDNSGSISCPETLNQLENLLKAFIEII